MNKGTIIYPDGSMAELYIDYGAEIQRTYIDIKPIKNKKLYQCF